MNPLCLLTKGRTFKDMTGRAGTYKVLEAGVLPRYSKKKPAPARRWHSSDPTSAQTSLFEQPLPAAKADVAESNIEAAMPVQEAPLAQAVQPPAPAPVPAAEPVKAVASKSPFAVKTTEKQEAPALAPAVKKGPGPVRAATGFCRKLWQQFVLGKKGGAFNGKTVQTELALEKVTVLRNNLSEDDLEVVLAERKVGTGEKPLARVSKVEVTGEAWLRLTAPFRKKNSDSASSPKAEKKASPELNARA